MTFSNNNFDNIPFLHVGFGLKILFLIIFKNIFIQWNHFHIKISMPFKVMLHVVNNFFWEFNMTVKLKNNPVKHLSYLPFYFV